MEGQNLIAIGLFILFSFTGQLVLSDNTCDNDWDPYKDEKCLKVFDTEIQTYEEAESYCNIKYEAKLVSIGSEDKQKFLENFLKSKEVLNEVWIGLKYESNNNYVWSDHTNFNYSNWATGSPKNNASLCVQVNTDGAEYGKWTDVLCGKKDLVLCEKLQPWPSSQLQEELLNLKKNVIPQLQDDLLNLKKNVIPMGFTYVQLPKEKSPEEIWSWMTWADVTSDYGGLFFRAEGGNSASFGSVQEENSPRLVHVHRVETSNAHYDIDVPANGQHSDSIDADDSNNGDRALQFTVSSGEVRPRNMAIRIWKRSG